MFYSPFVTPSVNNPMICYCDDSVSGLIGRNLTHEIAKDVVVDFAFQLGATAGRNVQPPLPPDTDYIIAFFWADGPDLFVDLWIQRQLETYGASAPMTTLVTYNARGEMVDPFEKGNACGDTRIVAGREEEYRRSLVAQGKSLEDYLDAPRPEMPEGFIIPWPELHRKATIKGGYGDVG